MPAVRRLTTRSGLSLNHCLHTGPKLQAVISAILDHWRFLAFIFTVDIVKMFRQFKMHDDNVNWFRILWRISPEEELQHYRMTTVVALLQLAQNERQTFPKEAQVLE